MHALPYHLTSHLLAYSIVNMMTFQQACVDQLGGGGEVGFESSIGGDGDFG